MERRDSAPQQSTEKASTPQQNPLWIHVWFLLECWPPHRANSPSWLGNYVGRNQVRVRVQGPWGAGLAVAAVMACGGRADKSGTDDNELGGASGALQGRDEGTGGAENTGGGHATGGRTFGAGGLGFSSSSGGFGFVPTICPSGTFDDQPDDGTLQCEPWTGCDPGSYIETFATHESNHVCVHCEEGFTIENNETSCRPWTLCLYTQRELTAPTDHTDRGCVPKEGYAAYTGHYASYLSYSAGSLLVTAQGTHQLIGGSTFQQHTGILRYLPTGDLDVLAEQAQIDDFSAIGEDFVLVGWHANSNTLGYTEIGYVQRRTASGNIVWQHPLSEDEQEHWSRVRVNTFDNEIYIVSRVEDCVFDASTGYKVCNDAQTKLMLQVFNSQGQTLQTTTLEEEAGIAEVLDTTVASDGQLYVMVQRAIPAESPNAYCESLDPFSPQYQQYCENGLVLETAVLQYGPTGDREGEHALGVFIRPVAKLVPTAQGTVYAFARGGTQEQAHLALLETGGQTLLDKDLPDWVQGFTTTSDGLFFAGFDATKNEQIFAEADPEGELTTVTRESDYAPFEVVDLAVDPNGKFMVAGLNSGYYPFVRPWPE